MGNVIDFNPYTESDAELTAYFGELDGAIGIHAQGEPHASDHVFDAAGERDFAWPLKLHEGGASGSRELHLRLRQNAHRKAVQRRSLVEDTLFTLPAETQNILQLAFEPRRFDVFKTLKHGAGVPNRERNLRILLSLRPAEAKNAARRVGKEETVPAACLIALALAYGVVLESYTSRHPKGAEAPTQSMLVLDLLSLAEDARRTDIARARRETASSALSGIRERTGAILMPALSAYDKARRARNDFLRDSRIERAKQRAVEAQALQDAATLRESNRRALRIVRGLGGADAFDLLSEFLTPMGPEGSHAG